MELLKRIMNIHRPETRDLLPVFLLLVALPVTLVNAHPLCYRWFGPFIPNELQKPTVCTRYSNYTCCFPEEEALIKEHFDLVINKLSDVKVQDRCRERIYDMLCLRCSPFFAHTYDYENRNKNAFPGLCSNFCRSFYTDCKDAIPLMTDSIEISQTLDTVDNFCQGLELSDPDYCYPDVIPLNEQALDPRTIENTTDSDKCVCLEKFADKLRNPLIFRPFPDKTGRVLVGEQRGLVYVYHHNGTQEEDVFMDLQQVVLVNTRRQDERGFLSLAFHPDFSSNGRVFVWFTTTTKGDDNADVMTAYLMEYRVFHDNDMKIDVTSGKNILTIPQPYDNHNGGELIFGFDGYLFLGTGDGGGGGDEFNYAQNMSTLLGKMLRIDIDNIPAGRTYGIPPNNPFLNYVGARHEIYAFGLRNPWRCDQDEGDPETGYGRGRWFCGDVGQGKWEEIDIIKKGGNYGWAGREGFECFKPELCGKIGKEELPIHAYSHEVGKSITGGHIYRGCESPKLNGKYIFADFTFGGLFWLTEDAATGNWSSDEIFLCSPDKCSEHHATRYEKFVLSFGEDINGEVYLLTTANALSDHPVGSIYKMVDPHRRGDKTKCRVQLSSKPDADADGTKKTADDVPVVRSSSTSTRLSGVLTLIMLLHQCI